MAFSPNSPPETGGEGGTRSGGPDAGPAAWLYRHRGTTAVPFALALVWGARPQPGGLAAGGCLLVLGAALRLWAVSHIGAHSRGVSLRAPRLITGGPYRRLRHPLYAGNGLVCAGLLLISGAYQPWLALVFAAAFVAQYSMFIAREERFLAARWGAAWADYRRRVPLLGPGRGAGAGPADRPAFRTLAGAVRLEWPTLRTILGLLALIALRQVFRRS